MDFWDFEFPGFWIFGISISGIFNFLNLIFWVFDFWNFLKIFRIFLTNTQKFLVFFLKIFHCREFFPHQSTDLVEISSKIYFLTPTLIFDLIKEWSKKNCAESTQKSPKSYTESGIFLCFFWIIFAVPIIFLFTRRWRKSTLNL